MKSFFIALCLFPIFIYSAVFSTMEEEYTPKYCLQLEAAYGNGLMSEGGEEGIDLMFEDIYLDGKRALDIGSGLGGVALYLADRYAMQVTGLEINPWMIDESRKRIPEHLKTKVDFYLSSSNSCWDFPNDSYDLIYSKGVLTHVEIKEVLLQECHRLLKDDGFLVITDWLSSDEKKWGPHIARLVELENLILFPESERGYIELLQNCGFTLVSVRDDSSSYQAYNQEIVENLKGAAKQHDLFSNSELEASIDGYQSIAKALKAGELRVIRFVAKINR